MSMDFEDQLKAAIERGSQKNASRRETEKQAAMSKEDLRNRHNDFRLNLSEYIDKGLHKMAAHFPGFAYETIYGHRGWGGALYREDLALGPDGRGGAFFSRLEITVRPQNEFNVVNITGKGTIKDKEIFSWNHFKELEVATLEEFYSEIDKWMLQYAEHFAAN